jgi:hypothetical protein
MKKLNGYEIYLNFGDCLYFLESIDKLSTGLRSEKNMTPYDIEFTEPEHGN